MTQINDCLLGLYEKALPANLTMEEKLYLVKQSGYDFLEISIDETDEKLARVKWDKVERKMLAQSILKQDTPILTMCLSGNRRFPIGSQNAMTRLAGVQLIKDAVDFSLDTGIRIVQLAGYDEYYNPSNDQTLAFFNDSIKEVAEYAAARGIILALETMETDLMDSTEKAMKYVNMIDSPYFQVYPDVGNVTAAGKNVEADFSSGVGHIVCIHLKDTKENYFRDIPFGEGIVDFVSFFQILNRMNYKGLFVAEMWATDDPAASIEYTRTARSFLLQRYEMAMRK